MPALSGRKIRVKKDSIAIAGVKSKTASFSGEGIDITSDDDSGYRTYLEDPSVRAFDLSVEGVIKDRVLTDVHIKKESLLLTDIVVEFLNSDDSLDFSISGNFYFSNIEVTGETSDAKNFSASFMSSEEWTVTEGP